MVWQQFLRKSAATSPAEYKLKACSNQQKKSKRKSHCALDQIRFGRDIERESARAKEKRAKYACVHSANVHCEIVSMKSGRCAIKLISTFLPSFVAWFCSETLAAAAASMSGCAGPPSIARVDRCLMSAIVVTR